jgi:uncharacterized protein
MRVLALADRPPGFNPAVLAERRQVDAVLCLGDLDAAWIEPLMSLRTMPRMGVHGNHDRPGLLGDMEVEDLHLKCTSAGGLTFAGFEGCIRYGKGGPHQYTQREVKKLAKKLPAADVLLCHCPPLGINDDPADPAHIGMEGLLRWVERHKPRHILHGHTHPIGPQLMTRFGDARVHWISGAKLLTLE